MDNVAVTAYLDSGVVAAGNDLSYQIGVVNHGNSTANNIIVTNTLPASITYVSDSNSDGFTTIITGNTVVWTKPSLAPLTSATLNLTARVADSVLTGTILSDVVRASTSDHELVYYNNIYTETVVAETASHDIAVTTSLYNGNPVPGSLLEYEVYYENLGDGPGLQRDYHRRPSNFHDLRLL